MSSEQELTEDAAGAAGTVSRRGLIGGGAVVGAFAAFSGVFGSPATTAAAELLPRGPVSRALHPSNGSRVGQRGDTGAGASALGFTAVPTSQADDVIVPDGYVAQVICRWGDPVSADGPAFRFDATNTADDQALQYARATTG